MKNPLTGKYTIDMSVEGKIIVHRAGADDIEINVPDDMTVSQPYVVNFSFLKENEGSMTGKYVMYSDINGAGSEVIVDPKDIGENDRIKDIRMDTDYLFFMYGPKDGEDASPIYVQLDNIDVKAEPDDGTEDGTINVND